MVAILGYSTGVWRLISKYFHQEFKSYLDEEVKKNKYLLVDPGVEQPPAAGSSTAEIVPESNVRQTGRSVTANRLLDELIINFGRLFTARNEPEFSGKRTSAAKLLEQPAKEIITSTSKNVRQDNGPDPDPGGGGTTTLAGTIIESDKFPRTSSSAVDNTSSDEDDVANDDDDGDEEEKWIKYWKNRERGFAAPAEDGDRSGGHCKAKLDACGP